MGHIPGYSEHVNSYDHKIDTDHCQRVTRDLTPVHITLNAGKKQIRIGCTIVTFDALEQIYKLYRHEHDASKITLQEGRK